MKKSILIASAIAAGTVAFIYLMKSKKKAKSKKIHPDNHKRSHHRTDVFAKAKEQGMHHPA